MLMEKTQSFWRCGRGHVGGVLLTDWVMSLTLENTWQFLCLGWVAVTKFEELHGAQAVLSTPKDWRFQGMKVDGGSLCSQMFGGWSSPRFWVDQKSGRLRLDQLDQLETHLETCLDHLGPGTIHCRAVERLAVAIGSGRHVGRAQGTGQGGQAMYVASVKSLPNGSNF